MMTKDQFNTAIEALALSQIEAGRLLGADTHVRMDLEADLGFVAGAREQLGEARRGKRTTTLRGEDKGRRRLALQLSQRPQFIAQERMRGFLAALGPAPCIVPVSNSIDDHCRSQSSGTLRPCRKPIRIMVASR